MPATNSMKGYASAIPGMFEKRIPPSLDERR